MSFKARRLSRLRAMPAQDAWNDLRGSDEATLVATWLEIFRRTYDPERHALARTYAQSAAADLRDTTVSVWLEARGIAVTASSFPATFGTATVRAHLDLDPLQITLYDGPLATVTRAFETCGSGVTEAQLRDAILAHEAFHALHPDCPDTVTEMAAHLFAGRVSALGLFGGVVDVVHVLSKGW